jgi:hypothetical protein
VDLKANHVSAGVYTTHVDILGGAGEVDEWGDPVESDTIVFHMVPMAITETREVVSTESDAQAVAVHYYTGRAPAGTAVTNAHRVKDLQTGVIYQVDYVNHPNSIGVPGDVRLDLRRVT